MQLHLPGFFSFFRLTQQNARAELRAMNTTPLYNNQFSLTSQPGAQIVWPPPWLPPTRQEAKKNKTHVWSPTVIHETKAANIPHNACTCKTQINTEPDKDKVIRNILDQNGNFTNVLTEIYCCMLWKIQHRNIEGKKTSLLRTKRSERK